MVKGVKRTTPVDREEKRPEKQWAMKARANWDDVQEIDFEDNPNKQQIPAHMIPDGMDFRWVTDSVLGQPFREHRAGAEKNGWTPVHPEDFEGRFDGMFTPKGSQGEIRMIGQVLMARPLYISQRAKQQDRRAALEQVAIKEQSITGGDMKGVSLDTTHPSALRSNRINRSVERIVIPES